MPRLNGRYVTHAEYARHERQAYVRRTAGRIQHDRWADALLSGSLLYPTQDYEMSIHPISWLVLRTKDVGREVRHPEEAGVSVTLVSDGAYLLILQWAGRREPKYIDPSDLPGSWVYPMALPGETSVPLLLRRGTPEIVEIMWDVLGA